MEHWTEKFFIKNGKLWLRVMNEKWKHGRRNAKAITKILKKFGIHKGKILELGCGNGRISINLAKMGYDATGIDIGPLCINDAIKRIQKKKVNARFICGDIREMEKFLCKKFGSIISIWTSIGFYNKQTDEKIFKKVYKLLKKQGIFMILNTMSREYLLHHFCPSMYDETKDFVILHKNDFDKFRSIIKNKWIFYKKNGENLRYITEFNFNLRTYSMHELVEMAEKAGLEFVEAYDALSTLAPARLDSIINMVFKKK